MSHSIRLAYFISTHGYGHAARACAIMEAFYELDPRIEFEIFTTVPYWFFSQSLSGTFTYHAFLTDIGLKQRSSLEPDPAETVAALNRLLPFDPDPLNALAERIRAFDCSLVLCDIAPMGIRVAHQAGVPSILIENFTWDWIYEAYLDQEPGFHKHIRYLKEWFSRADYHIQTAPVCVPDPNAFQTAPVSRPQRRSRKEIRESLSLADDRKLVLITMGGIHSSYPFLKKLVDRPELFFIIPGAVETAEVHPNFLLLPQNSGYYHPDLIRAVDLVIGKAGYSTIAEVYAAGVPFGYIPASLSRETAALAGFIEKEIQGALIKEEEYYRGEWIETVLPRLLLKPCIQRAQESGAVRIAQYVCERLKGRS